MTGWTWVAALGIGGDRCVDREIRGWIDTAPITDAARRELRRDLVAFQLEQLEQATGWSANEEAVVVSGELWEPLVEPVVAEAWRSLREPAVAWFVAGLSCGRAYRMVRDRAALEPAEAEAFGTFWTDALAEPALAEAQRESLGLLLDAHGPEFAVRVRAVLPDPP